MSASQGLVSVIVPAYNRVKYIEETVNSVLGQSYPDIEIIVVDDGSTDGTFELLETFFRRGDIVLLSHADRENRGQSASINVGLRKACGDFVAILDSDDYYARNSIQILVDAISQDCSVGMVYGSGEAVDSEGRFLGYRTLPKDHVADGDPNRLLLDCYIALPGGALTRSAVFDAVGEFEETFRASQDHDMALRIFEATQVRFICDVIFYYRKHSEAISSRSLDLRWRTGFEVIKRAVERYPYRRSVIRRRRAVLFYRLGLVSLSQNTALKAAFFLIISGLLDPLRAINVMLGREKVR